MMMNIKQYKKIKPLVIGIGVAGKRHLEAQLSLGIKTGIYTTNPQTKKIYKKNKNIIIFDNLKDGIDWSNLVHVCTPDDKHTEFVSAAIKKGKTILCEKSFTTSLAEAIYLQQLAHEYNAVVIVGQNYRLTPTFAETRKQLLKGLIGTITKIKTTYLHDRSDFKKRYSDKNFLYIGGSHAIDLALWIANDQKITDIKATSKSNLNYQITIKFSSGIYAVVKLDAALDRSISGSDLIVYGKKGKLVSHNKKDDLFFYKRGSNKPQTFKLSNISTYTTIEEIKIIDDYLLGRRKSYQPIPGVNEVINTIKIQEEIKTRFFK